MKRSRSWAAPSVQAMAVAVRRRPLDAAALTVLVVLTLWQVGDQLSNTALPGLARTLPFTGIAPDITFVLCGLLLILRGVRGERGWILIGLGAICWAAGDMYWTLALTDLNNPPVPSWADAGYLLFCPLTFAGIAGLVRGRVTGAPTTLIVDALAAALAVGAVSAAVVLEPVLVHSSGNTMAVATNLAYPLVDMLLVGLIVGATALGDWRLQPTWVLLGLSAVVFWVADSLYLITVANNTYQADAWFNPLWNASPLLAAWAAWLPVGAGVTQRRATTPEQTRVRGIIMPLLFALTALGLLVSSSFRSVGVIAILLATLSLLVIMTRLVLTWRENAGLLRASQTEAMTDLLTGLGNRRALASELSRRIERGGADGPYVLALFDLDGFKHYNDNFGHPAGDALLQRLGRSLSAHLAGRGTAYRMGGDEFCALIDLTAPLAGFLEEVVGAPAGLVEDVAGALSERGEGFAIGCSYGSILLPEEAEDIESALRIADQRMYAQKRGGRASAARQSSDVLLRALAERSPDLSSHLQDVAQLAEATATACGLEPTEIEQVRQAAELHDVGKVAIPDAILEKSGALDASEWAFIRRHTLIGERIVAAAPVLRHVAGLVRSSHENFDGTGYPEGLAGKEIPLGARIIRVCDAFDAMVSDRPYRPARTEAEALAELRRCAGSQFDPTVVERFCDALSRRGPVLHAVA